MKMLDDTIDFDAYFAEQVDESAKIRPASEFVDAVIDRFFGQGREANWMPIGFQKTEGKFDIRPGETTIWAGINGHGKALALDTPLPTPTGWSSMGDIAVGDHVFDENGTPCRVTFATQVMLNRPCYRITFSDFTEIVADADHLWQTHTALARRSWRYARNNNRLEDRPLREFGSDQSHKRTPAAVITTREIAETLTITARSQNGGRNHSIPVCGALQTPISDLPIDPYVLGAWLGDGTSESAQITCNDPEILEEIAATGVVVTKQAEKFMYGLTGGLRGKLAALNLLKNKHIPSAYLRASFEQRIALLQGLMDTDGHITNYGRCEFTSMRRNLAEQTLELVLSCGLQARMITGRAMLYGKDCGEKCRVTFTPDVPVFRLKRKADKVQKQLSCRIKHRFIVACEPISSVPVRCIQVDSPSHLYLASRAMIPTHNTTYLSNIMLNLMQSGHKVCLMSLEMSPAETMSKMVRQAAGTGSPSIAFIKAFHRWTDGKLWIYNHVGRVAPSRALAVATYARKELGVDHVVIDSLMKCSMGMATDDYSGQRDFVDSLCVIDRDTGLHTHLVCHMRKGENERTAPGKFDVKGAGEITDLVDNLLIVCKNLKKKQDEDSQDADAFVMVAKQRHHPWEGSFAFWFHRESQQFFENKFDRPRHMDFEGLS